MPEELEQVTTPEEVASTSEPAEESAEVTGESDTPEETDEQKNERELKEAADRSEKRAKGVQKRMDELTADKYAERKRADELAAMNAELLALVKSKNQQQPQGEREPQRDDFDNDVDYLRSVAKYDAKQEALALVKMQTQADHENRQRLTAEQEHQATIKDFITRRKEVEKTIPDYRDVIDDYVPRVPGSVQNMILRLPEGPLVAYHLAKNPSLEAQFNEQPEYMHGILLGQMLATIKSTAKTSSAPPPGKPVSSKAGTSSEPPSDPEAYRAWADKHMK